MYNEIEILIQLGRNVKAERTRKGYSQEIFAEKLGVNREYVSRIERGIQNLSVKKIVVLANILDININDLLRF